MPEHVSLTDPELHEPKGVAAASANQSYVANGAGSGAWSEPEPKGISAATSGQVLVADGAGSGAWTTTGLELYMRNVSNGANTTSCTAATDITMPLIGNGANNFSSGSVATGKLEFDATFNSGNGGLIIDQLGVDTQITLRISFQMIGTGGPVVIAKAILVPDKTAPTANLIKISSSPITSTSSTDHTVSLDFFHGGEEALYLQFNSDTTKDFTIQGMYVTATERKGT